MTSGLQIYTPVCRVLTSQIYYRICALAIINLHNNLRINLKATCQGLQMIPCK